MRAVGMHKVNSSSKILKNHTLNYVKKQVQTSYYVQNKWSDIYAHVITRWKEVNMSD